MPVSKKRTRQRRPSKRRDKAKEVRAKETQVAQQAASERKLTPAAYTRRRVTGWSLVGLAIVVFSSHFMQHLGFFSIASPGVQDLVFGYPMAGLLGIAGAIVLTK